MKVLKNFLYNAGYQVLIIIVPFILSPYVARAVGPEGIGLYSYTYSITVLFGMFANLGVLKYGNREIARCRNDRKERSRVFWELMSVKAASSLVVLTAFILYICLLSGEYRAVFFLQIPLLLSYAADVSWLFWGMQDFRITTAVSSAVKVLSVVLIFAFVRGGEDTYKYIFILSVSVFLVQASLWMFLPRYVDLKVSLGSLLNRHWKSMIFLFFPVLARSLYITMDKIMLGQFVGITEVGYYENVQSITTTLIHVLTALGDVVMPQMTLYFASRNQTEAEKLFQASFHLITFLAVGMMYGFIGAADPFVPWFYGESFSPSIPLLRMIAPLVVLTGYSDLIRNVFLLPRYKDKEYILALAAGAAVNFAVNYTLIPRWNSTGAIVGTLMAEMVVLAIQCWYVRKDLNILYYLKKTACYCVMGAVILAACRAAGGLTDNWAFLLLLDILIGGVLYTGCVLLYLRIRERQVFATVQKIWSRRRKKTLSV